MHPCWRLLWGEYRSRLLLVGAKVKCRLACSPHRRDPPLMRRLMMHA
jgi:hypothetical protein